MRKRLIVLLVVAVLVAAFGTAAHGQSTGTITGTVTDAATGAPVAGVTIEADATTSPYSEVARVTTGSGGSYSVTGLAAGWYEVRTIQAPGYVDQYYAGTTPIVVAPGGVVSGIDFVLQRPGTISGTVRNALTGAPLQHAWVAIIGLYRAGAGTDAQGVFTVSGLPAGTYTLAASAAGMESQFYAGIDCHDLWSRGPDYLWPKGPDSCPPVANATPVTVTSGGVRAGVDFALKPIGSIAGTVTGSGGLPEADVTVQVFDGSGTYFAGASSGADGAYSVVVPAGNYYVRTFSRGLRRDQLYSRISCSDETDECPPVTSGTPVSVSAGATTSGIDLSAPRRAGTITGTVTTKDGGSLADTYVAVVVLDAEGNQVGGASPVTGGYVAAPVPPGTYYVLATNFHYYSLPLYLNQLFRGIDCAPGGLSHDTCPPLTAATPVTVAPLQQVSGIDFPLTPAPALPVITGRVTGPTGEPIAGATVHLHSPVAIPQYCSTLAQPCASVSTDALGRYSFRPRPGTYYVAVDAIQGLLPQVYAGVHCTDAVAESTGCSASSVIRGTLIPVGVEQTVAGIDFVLTAGGAITGTVVDAATGAPLAGVPIEIYDSRGVRLGVSWSAAASTDAAGVFRTTAPLAAGGYRVKTGKFDGYIPVLYSGRGCPSNLPCYVLDGTPVQVAPGRTTEGIDFALDKGAVVTGRVTEAGTGQPVSESVFAYCDTVGIDGQPDDASASSRADADGLYTLVLPVERGRCYFIAKPSDYVGQAYPNTPCPICDRADAARLTSPIPVVRGTTVAAIDFALVRGGAISGAVIDAVSGLPISYDDDVFIFNVKVLDADGRVWAGGWAGGGWPDSYRTGRTLPAGSYFVRTYNTLGYADTVYRDGPCWDDACDLSRGVAVTVTEGRVTRGIDFAMRRGGRIEGKITEAGRGSPASELPVVLFDVDGRELDHVSGLGYYTFEDLPAGRYFVVADGQPYGALPCPSGGCPPTSGTVVVVSEGATRSGIDIVIRGSGSIAGTVRAADTGLAVADAEVSVLRGDGSLFGTVRTDYQGVYSLSGRSSGYGLVERLHAGTYYVRVSAPGYAGQLFAGGSSSAGTGTLALAMPVVVAAGQAVNGIDFVLQRAAAISGRVTDSATGLPVPGQAMTLYDDSALPATTLGTDSAGRYRFDGVSAGTYYVAATGTGAYINQLAPNLSCPHMTCSVRTGRPIYVAAGQTVDDVNLALTKGGAIAGVVKGAGGTPGDEVRIGGASVSAFTAAGERLVTVTADAQGGYVLDGLPTGSYFVGASSSAPTDVATIYPSLPCPNFTCDVTAGWSVAVTAGLEVSSIDIAIDRSGGAIGGLVYDLASGVGVVDPIVVVAYDADGRRAGRAMTSYGRYTIGGLPAGEYRVRTSNTAGYMNGAWAGILCGPGECGASLGTVLTLARGEAKAGIDLGLWKAGAISGRVTDGLTGGELAGVRLGVYSNLGLALGTTTTDADGRYVLTGLAERSYYVRTLGAAGHADQVYRGVACPGGDCPVTAGTPVWVVDEAVTPTIDFALQAAVLAFTDLPVQAGRTMVKAVHITELRAAIDTLRARSDLPVMAWTDPAIVPGVTVIRAVHLKELRDALESVYVAAGLSPPVYGAEGTASGLTVITAADVMRLRAAVVAIW